MWKETFFLLITLVLSQTCTGMKCLTCDDMVAPTDCGTVLTCGDHQQCFLESYVNLGGYLRYSVGCRDTLQCGQSDPADDNIQSDSILVCSKCCQDDLCNSKGCNTQGYPESRGPICYNCPSQQNIDDCNLITLCGRDEVCVIREINNTVTHVKRYQTSCELKTKCEGDLNQLTEAQRNDGICHVACCTDDLCNIHCNNSNIQVPSVAMTTTIEPTTEVESSTNPSNPSTKKSSIATTKTPSIASTSSINDTSITTTTASPDHCFGYDCQNGGKCTVEHRNPKCVCSPAYTGKHCEIEETCEKVGEKAYSINHTFDWNNRQLHISLVQYGFDHRSAVEYCQTHCLGELIQITTLEKFNLIHNYLHTIDSDIRFSVWVDGHWNDHHWITRSDHRLVEVSEAWKSVNTWGQDGHCARLRKDLKYVLDDCVCSKHFGFICEYII